MGAACRPTRSWLDDWVSVAISIAGGGLVREKYPVNGFLKDNAAIFRYVRREARSIFRLTFASNKK
jgi:hypothetical protein